MDGTWNGEIDSSICIQQISVEIPMHTRGTAHLALYDLNGRLLQKQVFILEKGNQPIQMNLKEQYQGLCLLKIKAEYENEVQQFVEKVLIY